MNPKKLMVLAVAAAFAAPVLGQQAGSASQPRESKAPVAEGKDRSAAGATAGGFAAMDRNQDGYLSRDEARDAEWNNRFSELDKDNDGRLSRSEMEALHDNPARKP
jgi:hypothetical protein